MEKTLSELLSHFIFKKYIKTIYIDNLTDNIADYYSLEELVDYGHYLVDEWEFDLAQNKLNLKISYNEVKGVARKWKDVN